MPTLTIKNIPEDLYLQLKQSAKINHRSINSEVIVCIEQAVRSSRVTPEAILTKARKLREATISYSVNDSEFTQAKLMGRS